MITVPCFLHLIIKDFGSILKNSSCSYFIQSRIKYLIQIYSPKLKMEKYFSATYTPTSKVAISNFSSMISTTNKEKPNKYLQTQRGYQDRSYDYKYLGTKNQSKFNPYSTTTFQRNIFRSIQKKNIKDQSIKIPKEQFKPKTNSFLKSKEPFSLKQMKFQDLKQMRETDSTSCQSPKAHFNIGPKLSDFKKLHLLGSGKYGNVYMVKHLKTGFICALKTIRKVDINYLKKEAKEQMINQLIRQIKIQMYLDHPNLIKLYTYFTDDFNIYLLMQLGCDGQLYDVMKKKPKLKEQTVSIITRQILQGLCYMHKKNIIHRDLKPQNVVLIHGFSKICDFGWSAYCSKQLRSTFCGTPLYLSPQILKGGYYNQKIDGWAIGTLAYELYTSQNPFKIKKKQDLSKIITDDFVMKAGTPQFQSFITSILKKDPNKRPDTQTIRKHPFIKKYKQLQTSEQLCSLVYKKQINVYKSYYK